MKAARMDREEHEIEASWAALALFFGLTEEEIDITYVRPNLYLVMKNNMLIGKINGAPDAD
jgi:hypothetical protein